MRRVLLIAAFVLVGAGCAGTAAVQLSASSGRHPQPCVSGRALGTQVGVGSPVVNVAVGGVVTVGLTEPEAYASSVSGPPPRAFPWLAAHSSNAAQLVPVAICRKPLVAFSLPVHLYAFRALHAGRYVLVSQLNPAYHLPHMQPRLRPLHPLRVTVVVQAETTHVYSVVAPLLHLRMTGRTLACQAILTSFPPAGCAGVPVSGLEMSELHHVSRFPGGWQTGSLRLTGTWNGRSLQLTAPILPASGPAPLDPPLRCRVPSTSYASALAGRIAAHPAGLGVLSTSACGSTAWVLVAVADAHTVDLIHRRFGHAVQVSGWLRSARAQ